jgi:hypothetical protein
MDQVNVIRRLGEANNKLPGVSLGWLVLVNPTRAWQLLSAGQCALPLWLPSLLAQWILLGVSQLVALQAVFELARYSGLTSVQLAPSTLAVAWQLILFALGIVIANACTALLLWGLARLVGITVNYQQSFILTSYTLLPALLGHALGSIVLGITQPLTRLPDHALALLVRPFTCGLATFTPIASQPLSLGWVFASYLDIAGLWSFALVLGGASLYWHASPKRTAWLGLGLVLLLVAVLTGWWRILQILAIR